MIKLKSRAINSIPTICSGILVVMLSSCVGVQRQTQQTAERVIVNTAPPVSVTQTAYSPTNTVVVETVMAIEDAEPEFHINSPAIDKTNIVDLEVVAKTFQNNPYKIVWVNDGNSFAIVNHIQVVRYNAQNLTIEAVYTVQEPAYILDISPDGMTIAVTEDQNSIELWDIETFQKTLEVNPGPFSEAVFLPDGNSLAVSSLEEIAVQIIDVESGNTIQTMVGFDTAAPVYRVKFDPAGEVMVWIARSGVQLMTYASMEMGSEYYHEDFINDLALHPSGEELAVATAGTVDGNYSPIIQLWNVEDESSGGEIILEGIPSSIVYTKSGDLIIFSTGSMIKAYQTSTLAETISLSEHTGAINWLALSPDGSKLVTTADDSQIYLWQVVAE
jgi:WD40 repeat protein